MQPHPHQPSHPVEAVLPRVATPDAALQDDAYIHAQVEDYLDRVCQPLIETQPYAVRTELRQEIAQHLYALVGRYV